MSAFETLRVYGGHFFHLAEHWRRLQWSCAGLDKSLPVSSEEMTRWVENVLGESGWKDAILRVSIHWDSSESGILLAIAREFKSHPKEWYDKGVELKTAVQRRPDPKADNPQIKCSQYAAGVLALLDQGEEKAHELLFLGPGGMVAEGTVSNIFIIKEKRVLTPSAGSGILSGVTRSFVIGLCRARGLEVCETYLTRHEIYNAEECFMTNTSSEVLPVVKVDGRTVGSGLPGPVTKILSDDFKQYLEMRMHDKN